MDFPFEPYPPQKMFIERLIEALQRGENALLESPTGTGKVSRCVCLCASVHLALLADNAHSSWISPHYSNCRPLPPPSAALQTLCLLTGSLAWQAAYTAALQYRYSFTSRGLELPPPSLDSEGTQLMRAAGTIKEPPTPMSATSSTALGDILRQASRSYTYGDGSDGAPGEAVTLGGAAGLRSPKIIYASRTHSQLSQVIKELKHSGYAPRMAVLGSREQLCVHPTVSRQKGGLQQYQCRQLTKARRCFFRLGLDEWLASGGGLDSLRISSAVIAAEAATATSSSSSSSAASSSSSNILDIEELARLGSERKMCSYYLGREEPIQRDAQLMLVPYNYLIDPSVRSQAFGPSFEWGNAVVILDEGHNVEATASESASFDLTAGDLARAIDELGEVLDPLIKSAATAQAVAVSKAAGGASYNSGGEAEDGSGALFDASRLGFKVEDAVILRSVLLQLEKEIDTLTNDSASAVSGSGAPAAIPGLPADVIVRGGEFIYEMLHKYNIHFGTKAVLCELMDAVVNYLASRDSIGPSSKSAYALDNLRSVIERIFRSEATAVDMCRYYKVVIHTPPPDDKSGGGGGSRGGLADLAGGAVRKKGRTLSYWCFSPSVAMAELKSLGVRSVVLASGTLSPLESYAAELRLPFRVRLENPHVISPQQVLIAVLGKGVTGKPLNSSYQSRETPEYKVELGATIANCLRHIPDGVLVFFPSYGAMASCVAHWKGENYGDVWKRIESAKGCVIVEDKTAAGFGEQIKEFNSAVAAGKGAVMLAVCRGKASEGIDFADAQGRGVLVTGLPYPPMQDPKVILKRRFLDDIRSRLESERKSKVTDVGVKVLADMGLPAGVEPLAGGQWYNQQAFRAVNQAIGRVIRHKNDYGVILLLDERFARERACVSAWLRSSVKEFSDFGKVVPALRKFFKDNETATVTRAAFQQESERLAALSAQLRASSAPPVTSQPRPQQHRPEPRPMSVVLQPVRHAPSVPVSRPATEQLASLPPSLFDALSKPATSTAGEAVAARPSLAGSRRDIVQPKQPSLVKGTGSDAILKQKAAFGLSDAPKHAEAPSTVANDPKAYLNEVKAALGSSYTDFRQVLVSFKEAINSGGASQTSSSLKNLAWQIGRAFFLCNADGTVMDQGVVLVPGAIDVRVRLYKGFLSFVPAERRTYFDKCIDSVCSMLLPAVDHESAGVAAHSNQFSDIQEQQPVPKRQRIV